MSRRGRRGTRGEHGDDGSWFPGGHGRPDDDPAGGRPGTGRGRRAHGSVRTSHDRDSDTGPPWESASPPWGPPGWDDTGVPTPGYDPADPIGGHPSGPLPLPPDDDRWPEAPAGFGYPDGPAESGYPGYGYQEYPEDIGGYRDAHDDDTDFGYAGYDAPGHGGRDYPEAGYPAGYGDTGTGYDPAAYHEDRYPDETAEGDHLAGDAYYHEPGHDRGGPADRDAGHGYPDGADWDEAADDEQPWADEDYEDEFLPGLSGGARRTGGSRPGDYRAGRGGSGGGRRPGKSGGGKRKRGMRRVAPWVALGILLVLFAGVGSVGLYYYRTYLHPPDYSGPGHGSVVVRIKPGDPASVVGMRLQDLGVVASARAFSNAARNSGHGTALEPGYYRVHLHMQASLAFALLLNPAARVQTTITIPEGERLSQIIALLGRETGQLDAYRRAIKDVKALNLPSFAHGNPEGYLYPATYNIQPNTPPIKVLQAMVTRFDQEAASVNLPSAAAHAFLKQNEVITVASLIQAEGRRLSDFPKIAEVIYNRLNSGQKLQLDSTVMFALHTYGIRASSEQTRVSSPYNTYLHAGLPPGPIDSPGDAAIQAALHPAHGGLLYFVTVDPKTGLTKFTSSYAQFQQYENELAANLAKGR